MNCGNGKSIASRTTSGTTRDSVSSATSVMPFRSPSLRQKLLAPARRAIHDERRSRRRLLMTTMPVQGRSWRKVKERADFRAYSTDQRQRWKTCFCKSSRAASRSELKTTHRFLFFRHSL